MTPDRHGLCDLFLPVTTFAEHDGIVLPHFGLNTHLVTRHEQGRVRGRLPSLTWKSTSWLGKRLQPEGVAVGQRGRLLHRAAAQRRRRHHVRGPAGAGLATDGASSTASTRKACCAPTASPGFNTPTGLVELCSSLYEDWGEDPLPYYEENAPQPLTAAPTWPRNTRLS